MTSAALQRQAALAGAALLAVLLVVVLDRSSGETSTLAPPGRGARWEEAQVWIAPTRPIGACAGARGPDVRGIVHPVLPCGVKLVVSAHGKTVRTEVVAEGPVATGREFALTKALASDLGVREGETVRWRFAG